MFNDVVCVIPARKGSKSIPRKNMKTLCGVPLFVFSVRSALQAGIPPSNIVVSSDDEDVLKLAKSWGVFAHRRPDEISGDKSSTEEAMLDVIENAKSNQDFKSVLLLQPTSPIRFNGRIQHALSVFEEGGYDSLLSTTKKCPFFWMERIDESAKTSSWVSTYHPRNRPMRQDITREDYFYYDNGNLYITAVKNLRENKCRIGGKVCVYPITELEGMQIDDPFEFEIMDRIVDCAGNWTFRFAPPELEAYKGTVNVLS